MAISLDKTNPFYKSNSSLKPFIYISKIVFVTKDAEWVNRLFSASLNIKFSGLDKNDEERKTSSEQLIFGAFITPYHRQPIMEVNRLFVVNDSNGLKDDLCKKWLTEINLLDLDFLEDERIEIITHQEKPSTIEEIISEIDKRRQVFEDLRLSPESIIKLIPNYRLDWLQNYGFSEEFNIGVTKPILLSGLSDASRTTAKRNYFQSNAITKFLANVFFIEKQLSVPAIKEIHKLLIKDGGNFRTQNVIIKDKEKTLTPPFSDVKKIDADLSDLISWFNQEINNNKYHPLFLSSFFHYHFIRIHPFPDGNGRIARVLLSLILLSFKIPPPISKIGDRGEYLNALRNADSGDIDPLIIFIGNRIIEAMNYSLTPNR